MLDRPSAALRLLTTGLLLGTWLSPCPLWAADFIVSTNADSGAGSLRQAIINSNASGGSNTITINSGVGTITLTSGDLPSIANNATIVGNNNTLSGGGTFRGLFVGAFSGTTLNPFRKPPSTLCCSEVMKDAVEGRVQLELLYALSNTAPSAARRSRLGVVRRL